MATTSALPSSSGLAEAMLRALSVTCIDEKKEPVLDCHVSGAQSKTLLNLVNDSMLLLATNVGAEEGTYQMLCAGKVEESKSAML